MNWIHDEETESGRLAVAIDRRGFTIRRWQEEQDEEQSEGFRYEEAFYPWEDYKKPIGPSLFCGPASLKDRIVSKAEALLDHYGASSDACGRVISLHTRYDCGFIFHF
jgi:hypothetical protein